MAQHDDEERLLRSVAMQNAKSILEARQRAEDALLQAKEALQRKTDELAHSLAMTRATLESTTDGILATDAAGRVTGFNEKFLEIWGAPRSIVAAGDHGPMAKLFSQNFAEPQRFLDRTEAIYASTAPESYDLLELADGRVFERFSRTQVVDNHAVGRVWSVRDVTAQRQAQEAVRKQSQWWRVTLSSIGDAVITTDTDGRITFLNAVAEVLTGWESEDAAGLPLETVFHIVNETTRQVVENPATKALRDGVIVGLANHTILITKNGSERPIDDSAAPIRDEQGNIAGVVLVFRDIADRKQAEAQLRQSEQRLRETADELRKVAANLSEADHRKNEFLAMLAHELRNPLAPIRNALQIVKLTRGDDDTVRSASEVMERQLSHMVRLVDDLLDVSRITRGKIELRREPVELAAVLAQAIETCRAAIDLSRHQVTVDLPPAPVILHADPMRLAQVFANLINNACKYSEPAGHIWLSARREGAEVVVSVKDAGVGIPAAMLPNIFEMFTQVDQSLERTRGGLGIGLTIVQRLVEMHSGSVTVDSEGAGRGSEFIVRLPVMGDAALPAKPPPSEPAVPLPRRILVVDDNRDSATSLAMLLKFAGNETRIAYDGHEAVEAAAAFHPDVVLLDIGLPRLNGYEVARRIRQHAWGQRVVLVALTGWGQDEDRERSTAAGFDAHMVKPVDYPALMTLLANLQRTDAGK